MAKAPDITTLQQACCLAGGVLSGVDKDQFEGKTPCNAWTVRELVEHIVRATDFFADVAELGAAPDDEESAAYMPQDLAPCFRRRAERLIKAFNAEGAMTRSMRLPSGETEGNIAIQVAIGELFVRSWDLAKATDQMFSDEGIAGALLASDWLALCDYVRTDSSAPFAAVLPSDGDAPLVDQLVAFLGRDPQFKPN